VLSASPSSEERKTKILVWLLWTLCKVRSDGVSAFRDHYITLCNAGARRGPIFPFLDHQHTTLHAYAQPTCPAVRPSRSRSLDVPSAMSVRGVDGVLACWLAGLLAGWLRACVRAYRRARSLDSARPAHAADGVLRHVARRRRHLGPVSVQPSRCPGRMNPKQQLDRAWWTDTKADWLAEHRTGRQIGQAPRQTNWSRAVCDTQPHYRTGTLVVRAHHCPNQPDQTRGAAPAAAPLLAGGHAALVPLRPRLHRVRSERRASSAAVAIAAVSIAPPLLSGWRWCVRAD
jgi:hypothetical protein